MRITPCLGLVPVRFIDIYLNRTSYLREAVQCENTNNGGCWRRKGFWHAAKGKTYESTKYSLPAFLLDVGKKTMQLVR
jgi:hypothetical protein